MLELPADLVRKELKDIKDGETVYVIPWTMIVDQKNQIWLDGQSSYSDTSHGTETMKVTKQNGEWICDISNCKSDTWMATSVPFFPLPITQLLR